ncbi:MAG: diguanylate cyclase [Pseudomonadota bacterium]|nr:diguanylate cyclase [Pseudomonadota bacterium]
MIPASPSALQAVPDPETARLEAVRGLDLLDTPPEAGFDLISELAARLFQLPVVLITLVEQDRVWCKSRFGLQFEPAGDLPGMRPATGLDEGPCLVADAQADPRTRDHRQVTGAPGLRFLIAIPLCTREHHAVGALVGMDLVPRNWTGEQTAQFALLARLAVEHMELRRGARRALVLQQGLEELRVQLGQTAARDALTGSWNFNAVMVLLQQAHARSRRDGCAFAVMVLEVDGFEGLAPKFSSAAAGQILAEVGSRLRATLRGGDAIGRVGEARFLCVLESFGIDAARLVAERCRAAVARLPVSFEHLTPHHTMVSVSVGLVLMDPAAACEPGAIVEHAEHLLDQSRADGGNRVSAAIMAPSA